MALDDVPVQLAVLGPPDLLVTALVAGLTAHGVDARRVPLHESPGSGGPIRTGPPGVLIVDIDTHSPARTVRCATGAGMTVLAIGSDANRERAAAAIAAGAVGWIRKTSSIDALAETVRAAADGRMRMSDTRRAAWLAEHRSAGDSVRAELDRLQRLSPREREVLRHLADGRRAADVSDLLFLSITTVRSHIRSILVKLGVNSQLQATDLFRNTTVRLARIREDGSAK